MTPPDPAVGDTMGAGRDVIVEQAFGGVEQILLFQPKVADMVQHVNEVAVVRLVRADVLSRIDGVEFHAQLRVRVGESAVVDVREDDQLVVFLQILERAGAVRERRPVLH